MRLKSSSLGANEGEEGAGRGRGRGGHASCGGDRRGTWDATIPSNDSIWTAGRIHRTKPTTGTVFRAGGAHPGSSATDHRDVIPFLLGEETPLESWDRSFPLVASSLCEPEPKGNESRFQGKDSSGQNRKNHALVL
eukprot:scaffold738_cov340-Pavlova_lutheri.AAC.1